MPLSMSSTRSVLCVRRVCTRCSSRECFRAVFTQNIALLDAATFDLHHVADPLLPWSADCHRSAMHAAIDEGNKFLVRKLLHQLNMVTWANSYNKSEDLTRCTIPTHSLKKESGQASFVAYGHRVKAVQVSRGGKEGNNAFVGDDEDSVVMMRTAR